MKKQLLIVVSLTCPLVPLACLSVRADDALDILVASYPDHLDRHDGKDLFWKDGSRLPLSDGRAEKTFEDMLNHASIVDQFSIPYRLGRPAALPAINEDPGRIRNEAFFLKMYGDCRKSEVAARVRPVAWLPHAGGRIVMATTVNGVADKLEKISAELEQLPPSILEYATPSSGTYNCRTIAGTNLISMHSYGAAIDINAKVSDYWRWSMKDSKFEYRNRIPYEIVEIFERHGFVWGGKWYHFDTMHFEYRPEIINLARRNWVR